jgi:hypothetical protein
VGDEQNLDQSGGAVIAEARSPTPFLNDPVELAKFVDSLRVSGVRAFEHPSGLKVSFQPRGGGEGW